MTPMRPEIVAKLRHLNQSFYDQVADSFAESRRRPQPGFGKLLAYMPAARPLLVLDVGCGEGRFGRFLRQRNVAITYTGIDFSKGLLAHATRLDDNGRYLQRDMGRPGFLDGLGQFDLICCLAALQHLPGQANRARLLQEMAAHLAADGRLFLANWQFLNSRRQQRKIRPWTEVGLAAADVEPQDYLLTWQREGFGLRYVAMVDAAQTAVLAAAADLIVETDFYSDGREGNLSLYTVLRRKTG